MTGYQENEGKEDKAVNDEKKGNTKNKDGWREKMIVKGIDIRGGGSRKDRPE